MTARLGPSSDGGLDLGPPEAADVVLLDVINPFWLLARWHLSGVRRRWAERAVGGEATGLVLRLFQEEPSGRTRTFDARLGSGSGQRFLSLLGSIRQARVAVGLRTESRRFVPLCWSRHAVLGTEARGDDDSLPSSTSCGASGRRRRGQRLAGRRGTLQRGEVARRSVQPMGAPSRWIGREDGW